MKRMLSAFAALLGLAAPAAAQGFEKGKGAFDRGEFETALRELRPLAAKGDPFAQTLLGYMYNSGEGVPLDHAEAVKWYLRAADQGYASAQYNLGLMFADGTGVPQDDVTSLMWFSLADAQGDAAAAKEREIVAANMPPDQVEEAEQKVREWMQAHPA